MGKLNIQQKEFGKQFVIDFNATQAAIRAGYSKKTAKQIGSRLLTNVDIQNFLHELSKPIIAAAEANYGITLEAVQKQYQRFVFQDIRKYYNEDNTLKNIHDLDDDAAATLAGIEVDEIKEFDPDSQSMKIIGFTKKIKRWDAPKALDGLVKLMGYAAAQKLDVKVEQPMTDAQVDKLISALRENKAK